MALGQAGCLGGQVTDLSTGAALNSATVTAQECPGCEIFSTTTGAGKDAYAAYDGVYVFDPYAFGPQIEQVAPADAVKLTVSKSGYVSRTLYHDVELMTDPTTGRKFDVRSVPLVSLSNYYGAGRDSDYDGLSNYEEGRLGTDPYDSDTDDDGLLDGWEVYGDNWVDYPALGADPLRMDLFLEIDYQAAAAPSSLMLQKLVALYRMFDIPNPDGSTGVFLHPILDDVLPATDASGSPYSCDADWHDFDNTAWPNFDNIHRGRFFYAELCAQPNGIRASYGGGDLGGFYVHGPTTDPNKSDWYEPEQHYWYGVMAHELGHAAGLHHGGGDFILCKPNYHSIMNSAYREVSWGGTATLAGTKAGFSDGLFVDMPLIEEVHRQ